MKPSRIEFGPAKEFVTPDFTQFIEGQVERNSFAKGEIYVAVIDRAVVDGNLLRLGFSLVFNGERHPPFPKEWKRDDTRNSCVIDLNEYTVADISPGIDGGENRWVLLSADKHTMAILYPANGRKFDDARLQELLATSPVATPPKGPPTCRVSGAKACN